MRKTLACLSTILLAVCLAKSAVSAPFNPVFQLKQIHGACQVMQPGGSTYLPAEDGRAYGLGTAVSSAPDSTFVIVFSDKNECAVSGEARLRVIRNPADEKARQILLEQGVLDISLEAGYESANKLEVVAHCATISCLKGGKSSVDAKLDQDLYTQTITSIDTELKVAGPQFSVALLKKEQALAVTCAADLSYIRVKDIKGHVDIEIRGADGNPETLTMDPGTTVKIMQKPSDIPGTTIVAILIVGPDGQPLKSNTYNVATEPPQVPEGPTTTTGTEPPPTQPPAEGQWEPFYSTTTTTSTTSTTQPTIEPPPPSPTPVGLR